ncbi:MAG: protein kinase domain-containing protein, partial [Nocardioides sp.]
MQADRRGRARDEARSQDPMIGRTLDGRYRITDRIARGGMASVYTAHDNRLDRTVAIKIMHAGLDDRRHDGTDEGAFAARFVREARAAARLAHPNVVAVYDQGEDDGIVFLAMEYVPGHTLRDTVTAEAPMPARKALAVMEPVLGA